jgi:hypothetical protein
LSLPLTAAAFLIGLGGIWFVIETSRLRAQLAQAQREGETQQQHAQTLAWRIAALEAQGKQLTEERNRLQAQLQVVKEADSSSRPTPPAVFFALSISEFRDSGSQEPRTLTVPRGAEEVRLRLNLAEHEFTSYEVTLLTADGREVLSRKGLRARTTRSGNFLTLSLPSHKFASGDHVLALSGVSAADEVENLGKTVIKVKR